MGSGCDASADAKAIAADMAISSIDRLRLSHSAHLELAALNPEGEAALDQVKGVLPELVEAPP
jgi:hypothetical protein